jgi:energy-coupling factor transport system substrate-specific component
VCGIHGFAFGTLYAPAQAIMFGMNFETMLAWIIAGLPWDIIHGIGNFFAGMLVVPLSELIEKLAKKRHD